MGTYYAVQGGSRILNASRVDQSGSDDTDVTNWTKTNDFILAVNINSAGRETVAAAYKIRWRDVTDAGSFADVASTGEIKFGATDLTNGNAVTSGERVCSQQGGDTFQDGWEVEGTANSGSIDLVDEYESELQFSLSAADSQDGHQYEFELYDVTKGETRGACGATLTLASAAVAPTVTTSNCDTITATTSLGHGEITATGGENATRRGFCYMEGSSGDPTTANSVAYDDGDFGAETFSKTITGLSPSTNYRVRAYAVNGGGTGYGTTVQLTTIAQRTLACASGSLSLSGTATTLKYGRKLACDSGSLSLAGTATELKAGRKLACASGSIALAGTDVVLKNARKLAVASGALALAGTAVAFARGYVLSAGSGSIAFTGPGDPSGSKLDSFLLDTNSLWGGPGVILWAPYHSLAIGSGAFTVTGSDVGLEKGSKSMPVGSGALSVSGSPVNLYYGRKIAAASGSIGLSGTATGLLYGRKLATASGALSLAGTATGLLYGRKLATASGSLSLAGTDIALKNARKLDVASGSVSLAGTVIALKTGWKLATASGSLSLAGTAVALNKGFKIPALSGALTLSGTAVILKADRKMGVSSGAIALSGADITLNKGCTLALSPGAIALAGTSVDFLVDRALACDSGSIVLTGTDIVFFSPKKIEAESGTITLSGSDINMAKGLAFVIDSGAFYVDFNDSETIFRLINTRYAAADDAPRERSPSSRGTMPHLREFTTARAVHSR